MDRISRALGISKGDVISFVGAGGKSSLIFAICGELSDMRIAITTTTKMARAQLDSRFTLITQSDLDKRSLENAWAKKKVPMVYSSFDADKVVGVDESMVGRLSGLADCVLVEADGGRGKSFKLPRAHEPVVPHCSNKVAIVVGFDAFEAKVEDACFHSELVKQYFDEGIMDVGSIGRALYSESGYLKCASAGRELYLLVNKCDLARERAHAVSQCRMLYHPAIKKVVLASANEQYAIKVDNSRDIVVGIILAGGLSKRFGGNKLLAEINSKPVLQHVIDAAESSNLDKVILVVGNDAERVLGRLKLGRTIVVKNADYGLGMSTSLICGLRASPDADAAMFILGDQPCFTTNAIDEMLARYKASSAQICAPFSNGKRRNPVIIGKPLFGNLFKLKGDKGARDIVDSNPGMTCKVEFENEDMFVDIDTNEDISRINR